MRTTSKNSRFGFSYYKKKKGNIIRGKWRAEFPALTTEEKVRLKKLTEYHANFIE